MSPRPVVAYRAPERGFVLVGVVMMVLALTIIGVSLYSLSGYESQFFGRSFIDRQALYTANGGVELAKRLLITPIGSPAAQSLSNVKLAIGREGIVSAVAWYDNPFDSTGPMRPNTNVHVRVGVNVFGIARTVQGTYNPGNPNSPYWRLFSSTTPITYSGATGTLRAQGGAWQPVAAASDTAWIASLEGQSSVAVTADVVPASLAAPFITAHYPSSPSSPDTAWVSRNYNPLSAYPHYSTVFVDMDAGPAADSYKYFRSASDTLTVIWTSQGTKYDFVSGANVHLRVRGTAIWILPRGALFDGEVVVERLPGATTANLVIVAGPSTGSPVTGVWFNKAVRTPLNDVNVFIVSNSTVRIQDAVASNQLMEARRLCIYADAIRLSGPASGTHVLDLRYPAALRPVADQLYGLGLLPGVTGMQSTTFALVPGSWTTSPGLQ